VGTNKAQKVGEIRIRKCGAAVGLIFEGGGDVEVLMAFADVSRLLEAWRVYEKDIRKKPRAKVLSALETLRRHTEIGSTFRIVAEVPIAARRARLEPVLFEKPRRYRSIVL